MVFHEGCKVKVKVKVNKMSYNSNVVLLYFTK